MRKDALRSAGYVFRDVAFCVLLFAFAISIETMVHTGFWGYLHLSATRQMNMLRAVLWLWYWWWQGIVFTSFFCIGVSILGASLVAKGNLIASPTPWILFAAHEVCEILMTHTLGIMFLKSAFTARTWNTLRLVVCQ